MFFTKLMLLHKIDLLERRIELLEKDSLFEQELSKKFKAKRILNDTEVRGIYGWPSCDDTKKAITDLVNEIVKKYDCSFKEKK